jgi:hypothetical protein
VFQKAGEKTHGSAEEAEGLVLVFGAVGRAELTAEVNTFLERPPYERFRRIPRPIFYPIHQSPRHLHKRENEKRHTVRDIVLHPSPRIDLEFARIDGAAEARVVFARIFALAVAFWVVDVFGGEVHAEAVFGHFEFGRRVAVGLGWFGLG